MKLKYISLAALSAVSLLFSSCVYGPGAGYGTFSYATNGYQSGVAWTNASYDANGFPIFGYSYGRPVYGYTEAGVAIFTIAALTALCFVPHWKPAPWYHGHWHYPPHIHRVAAPPHFPAGHRPGVRPPGGIHAPIHRNPGAVFKPHGNQPGMMRPHGVGNMPGRPNVGGFPGNRPGGLNTPAPHKAPGIGNRPGMRPGAGARPGNAPGISPQFNNKPGGPQGMNRPGMGNNRPGNATPHRPVNRPQVQAGGHRPQAAARPAMGARPAARPAMGGAHRSPAARGGHGAPRR